MAVWCDSRYLASLANCRANWSPWRWAAMWPKERTCQERAVSSGQLARTALSWRQSTSGRVSGWVRIQRVTARADRLGFAAKRPAGVVADAGVAVGIALFLDLLP